MRASILWTLALILPGCIQVADERAIAEDGVGREVGAGVEVEVSDGLAAIRGLVPGRLELWGQAPSLEISVQAEEAGEWLIDVRNVMPGVEVTGAPAVPEPRELPTHKAWRVQLQRGVNSLSIADAGAAEVGPFRIIAFADVQDAIDRVQDLYVTMADEEGVHFGLISGDLTDTGSVEELERFQKEMETLPFPLFATLGNHELGHGSVSPPFHQLFGRGSFSFEHRGARFTLLDSGTATIADTTYQRLEGWLDAGRRSPHLVMTHMPPLDTAGFRNNAFSDRNEAHKLLGMLADGGVDLTIYGHVHTHEEFTNVGIDAHITGGGGGIQQQFDGIQRHFLTLDVDPVTQRFATQVVRVPD